MHDIQMVDLKSQHNKIKNELDSAIDTVLESAYFIKGPQVAKFESNLANYLGCKYTLGCGNGTDALQIALMALGLEEGDEVITSDFTFVATAEVVKLLNLKLVLVDCEPNSFNISIQSIKNAISPKTKVIIPVHLFGQSCDMETIMEIANQKGIYVIEDTAQALGTEYIFSNGTKQKVGTIGHIGCTSFFPSKNLGTAGDGGAIFTNNDELFQKMKSVANHGQGEQYYYSSVGINSRLDTIQAAILDVKLPYLDNYNSIRRQNATKYTEKLSVVKELITPFEVNYSSHIYHQYTLKVLNGKRDELMKHLQTNNIPCKVYYPVPIHQNNPYKSSGNANDLQNSIALSNEVISLPMHTELTDEQIDFITNQIINFFTN